MLPGPVARQPITAVTGDGADRYAALNVTVRSGLAELSATSLVSAVPWSAPQFLGNNKVWLILDGQGPSPAVPC